MRVMETYANSNHGVSVTFNPGTYVVNLPVSGEPGYRGLQQGACMMADVSGVTIDAANAEFYCTNLNSSEQSVFRLKSCTNVTINAQFRGVHTGFGPGTKAIHLVSNNSAVKLKVKTTRMWDGVSIGDYADPFAAPTYEGNHNITVTATNTDTFYGVVAWLTRDINIVSESEGTSANSFGAHRNVYIAGCTNVLAHSYFKNLNVPDGCNLITSAPSAVSPHHFGCSNVTLYATDTGTTHYVQYQSVVKLGVITSPVSATNIQHKHIQIHVVAPSTTTMRTNNYAIAIGSLGAGAEHSFDDITLSGTFERGPSNIQATVQIESNLIGLSSLQLILNDFHDAPAPRKFSVIVASSLPKAVIEAAYSDINQVYLVAPAKQTFQNYGQRSAPRK